MSYRIPLAYNSLGVEEIDAADEVLHSGLLTQGKIVSEFEGLFAAWHGVAHAIFVNSGSSANLIAIESAIYLSRFRPDLTYGEIGPGDEVIIQGLNWPSTLKPLTNHGLVPVFCDVDLASLNASVADIDAVRTNRTRAVVAVPVLGNPTHLDEVRRYCADNELVLIEDACESLGATTRDRRKVGTLGLASSFSFYFSHHLTTIEGGMALTDDPHLADLCYALRAHGWSRHLRMSDFLKLDASQVDDRFCFVLPGYNVRSTELNAAIGKVQLSRLPDILGRRRAVAEGRIQALEGSDRVVVPGKGLGDAHSWMAFPMLFTSRWLRDRTRTFLEEAGIETRPIIVGNTLRHPLSRNIQLAAHQPDLPSCDAVFEQGLMIGLDPYASKGTEEYLIYQLNQAVRA